jgi:hypothetical protein
MHHLQACCVGVQQTLQTEPESRATVDDNEKFRKMTEAQKAQHYDITEKNGYKVSRQNPADQIESQTLTVDADTRDAWKL